MILPQLAFGCPPCMPACVGRACEPLLLALRSGAPVHALGGDAVELGHAAAHAAANAAAQDVPVPVRAALLSMQPPPGPRDSLACWCQLGNLWENGLIEVFAIWMLVFATGYYLSAVLKIWDDDEG